MIPMRDAVPLSAIPCTRYDQPAATQNERVLGVLRAALDDIQRTGGTDALIQAVACIECLHDHKGLLTVSMRYPLSAEDRQAFRRAWEAAYEAPENVEFEPL